MSSSQRPQIVRDVVIIKISVSDIPSNILNLNFTKIALEWGKAG
jgi:hypothetical protein